MTRVDRAVYGQLAGVLLASLAWVIVYPPVGISLAGAGLVWWWRYVYDVGGAE